MTGGRLRFVPMRASDLPRVLAIERASFPTPWTEENFRHEIEENPMAWNVIAERDGLIVGFACSYVVGPELMINDIAVDPAHRRTGVGGAIVRHLLEGGRERGCRLATLEVRPSNTVARSLYDAEGFAVAGTRKGYYADTGEDAVLMSRAL